MGFAVLLTLFSAFISVDANAALAPPKKTTGQLALIRKRITDTEQELIDGLRGRAEARANVRKIKMLLKFQSEERRIGLKRQAELESTVKELESRKAVLDSRLLEQRAVIRRSLVAVEKSIHVDPVRTPEHERWEAPRRHVLAALVDRGIKETEALRIDLADADKLEARIADEKQQLAYMIHDLDEQRSVLELNQNLQADLLKKRQHERVIQLENYRKLKIAEGQVEDLIQNFSARVELQKEAGAERRASEASSGGKVSVSTLFSQLKGHLMLPVAGGKILTAYGRAFDPKSGLYVFKKGIEIRSDKKQPVLAISAGKIAFSGDLADYGRVAIIDHGDHFYSLCAHLGSVYKKAGDKVMAGESVGVTDDSGTPVYFEIRSRNVAVNPLQWISN